MTIQTDELKVPVHRWLFGRRRITYDPDSVTFRPCGLWGRWSRHKCCDRYWGKGNPLGGVLGVGCRSEIVLSAFFSGQKLWNGGQVVVKGSFQSRFLECKFYSLWSGSRRLLGSDPVLPSETRGCTDRPPTNDKDSAPRVVSSLTRSCRHSWIVSRPSLPGGCWQDPGRSTDPQRWNLKDVPDILLKGRTGPTSTCRWEGKLEGSRHFSPTSFPFKVPPESNRMHFLFFISSFSGNQE